MPYGLKYTLTQILRDGTNSVVSIYEKDYVGATVIAYDAVNIEIQANSSGDEPLPQIISSQLNISFIIPIADNSTTFPSLLDFDDRKYYVEYENGANTLWVGFLFNDYITVPFTTGYVTVNLVATDGLKFLEYEKYNLVDTESINATTTLIQVIGACLNVVDYPTQLNLITSCSYYADTMDNRSTVAAADPFWQSYQYRRDFLGLSCYEVLTNVITSFGCRLFQSDGKWQILAINQQADTTQYYTEYEIDPIQFSIGSGTLNNNITIAPYATDSIYFIGDSQTKIIRKGYPRIELTSKWEPAPNYAHNGDFKAYTDPYSVTGIVGWTGGKVGAPLASAFNFFIDNESEYNDVFMALFTGNFASGYSVFLYSGTSLIDNNFLPYISVPSFTVKFQYKIQEVGQRAKMNVMVKNPDTGVTWYYNQSGTWQNTAAYIFINYAGNGEAVSSSSPWSSYSEEFSLISPATGSNVIKGYVRIKIFIDDFASNISNINVRGINISQTLSNGTGLRVSRYVTNAISTTKQLDQPYGFFTITLTNNNFKGVLFNSAGAYLENWYKQGFGSTYDTLQHLMALQYSNLLNKNFGTLEGDLGVYRNVTGLNYLSKNVTITDASTNALSYNGKKFIVNRANLTPYTDEVNSLQLIETTNTNNDSTVVVEYLTQ